MSARPELFPGLPITSGMLVPTQRDLPPVPLTHTDIVATIVGPLCNVVLTQQFHNTHTAPIEAIYVFPLPQNAAVTALTLTIGERVIRGEIREHEQAQREYQDASNAGQTAALLDQQRPNLFTIAVANLQPNERVDVQLRFHDRVPFDDGAFTFSLPTVVLPRYVPKGHDANDARTVTATPLLPADADGHTLSVRVELDVGRVTSVASPSHAINVSDERGATVVTLDDTGAVPNKDFVLRYAVAGNRFAPAAFSYRVAGQPGTLLLSVTPNVAVAPEDVLPRELLFVLDRSGSMTGDSITQARNALHGCLRSLNPDDTFNIFPFDNRVEQFAPQPVPFTQEQVDAADAYIAQINARGGTEILDALQTALAQPRDAERLRVVVFLTDGAVGNEDQVLRELGRSLNEARVFAFGIGTAINRFLLDKLAEVGRGSVEYVMPGEAIDAAVERFQSRAAFPLLADVQIDWGRAPVADVLPAPLPDLYAGQPLTVLARFHNSQSLQSLVRVRGRTQRGAYEQTLEIEWPTATPDRSEHWAVLEQVWARAQIDVLMTSERHDRQHGSSVRDEILALALEQHLLSPYTAFVATEEGRADHAERETAERVLVPVHLPQGTQRSAFEQQEVALRSRGVVAAAMLSAPSPSPFRLFGGAFRRTAPEARVDDEAPPMLQQTITAAPREQRGRRELTPVERRDAALRFLARTQAVSGAWADSPVATALALLAFVRAGHTDRAGTYRPQLTRTIRWLITRANQSQTPPVVAWALAELAAATRAESHAVACTAATQDAAISDMLDFHCLHWHNMVAEGSSNIYLPTLPEAPALTADLDERDVLTLALYVQEQPEEAQRIATALAQGQQRGGDNDGAVMLDGQDAEITAALTAVGAMVWG